ncbi:MAG: hypothetical protein ACYDHZ_00120 [Dehalococcoidia bacterium]
MNKSKHYLNILLGLFAISTGLISGCASQQTQGTQLGTPIFQDDFKNPQSGWYVYKADYSKTGAYGQGEYDVWSVGKNTVIVLNPKTTQSLRNFEAEVDVRKTSTLNGAVMGMIYRLDADGNYYRFSITDNQTYYVSRGVKGLEREMQPETPSDVIKPGNEYNQLKVVCSGYTQDFFINGSKLTSITDNTSSQGELGIAFGNWTPSENFTFTNFKLFNLK